jgi:hypothetical protein
VVHESKKGKAEMFPMRSGQDDEAEVPENRLQERAMIVSMFAPYVTETLRTALVYTLHHSTSAQREAGDIHLTRETMVKAMKYQLLHQHVVARAVASDVNAYIRHARNDLDFTDDDVQVEFVSDSNDDPPSSGTSSQPQPQQSHPPGGIPTFSQAGQEAIRDHYENVLRGIVTSGDASTRHTPGFASAAARSLIDSVMHVGQDISPSSPSLSACHSSNSGSEDDANEDEESETPRVEKSETPEDDEDEEEEEEEEDEEEDEEEE